MTTTEAIRPENQELADEILSQIRAGVDDWNMPWHKGIVEAINPVTHKIYTGYNATLLWQEGIKRGYKSNKWATLKQWRKLKGMVRAGSKGVALYRPLSHQIKTSGDKTEFFVYAYHRYHVFNDEQINNVNLLHPDLFANEQPDPSGFNQAAQQVTDASGAIIKQGENSAYYSPTFDYIGMPHFSSFFATSFASQSENYYATLMHELIHWTKGPGRTPRTGSFEEQRLNYAFEELVAELGASILCTRLDGLVVPRKDHAAYLQSWLGVLEHDIEYFYQSMQLAQQAADWLCSKAGIQLTNNGWVKTCD